MKICRPAQHIKVTLHRAACFGLQAIITCSNVPKFLDSYNKKRLMMVHADRSQ